MAALASPLPGVYEPGSKGGDYVMKLLSAEWEQLWRVEAGMIRFAGGNPAFLTNIAAILRRLQLILERTNVKYAKPLISPYCNQCITRIELQSADGNIEASLQKRVDRVEENRDSDDFQEESKKKMLPMKSLRFGRRGKFDAMKGPFGLKCKLDYLNNSLILELIWKKTFFRKPKTIAVNKDDMFGIIFSTNSPEEDECYWIILNLTESGTAKVNSAVGGLMERVDNDDNMVVGLGHLSVEEHNNLLMSLQRIVGQENLIKMKDIQAKEQFIKIENERVLEKKDSQYTDGWLRDLDQNRKRKLDSAEKATVKIPAKKSKLLTSKLTKNVVENISIVESNSPEYKMKSQISCPMAAPGRGQPTSGEKSIAPDIQLSKSVPTSLLSDVAVVQADTLDEFLELNAIGVQWILPDNKALQQKYLKMKWFELAKAQKEKMNDQSSRKFLSVKDFARLTGNERNCLVEENWNEAVTGKAGSALTISQQPQPNIVASYDLSLSPLKVEQTNRESDPTASPPKELEPRQLALKNKIEMKAVTSSKTPVRPVTGEGGGELCGCEDCLYVTPKHVSRVKDKKLKCKCHPCKLEAAKVAEMKRKENVSASTPPALPSSRLLPTSEWRG